MASSVKALVPTIPPLYARILSSFPEQYFRFCFGYGSAVFKQAGVRTSNPMIDLIFVVDDSAGFHGQNIHMNPSHYSSLKGFGSKFVTKFQEGWPARVYFNTLIHLPEEDVLLKYGVISSQDLINDLLDWNYLYIAGRLHKPVNFLIPPVNKDMKTSLKLNCYAALHASLLILPEYFTERQLYRTIANLSYTGDFRMTFGEDKNKVKNIVDAQIPAFRELYAPFLSHLSDYVEIPENESVDQTCMQDTSPETRTYHLYQLPKEPQRALVKYWNKLSGRRIQDTEEVLRAIAFNPDVGIILQQCLSGIVFSSSLSQSIKGIFTAGLVKSFKYSNRKINKMLKSANTTQ